MSLCKFQNLKKQCVLQPNTICYDETAAKWETCYWYKQGFTGIDKNVEFKGQVTMGKNVRIKSGAVIYYNVTIGDNVSIGHYAIIYENVILREGISIPDFGRVYHTPEGINILAYREQEFIDLNKEE